MNKPNPFLCINNFLRSLMAEGMPKAALTADAGCQAGSAERTPNSPTFDVNLNFS